MSLRTIRELSEGTDRVREDDRIVAGDDVVYDAFLESDRFEHVEMKDNDEENIGGSCLAVDHHGKLHVDGDEVSSGKYGDVLVAAHESLCTVMTNLPHEDIVMCSSENADVRIDSDAVVRICVSESGLHVRGFSSSSDIYWNMKRTDEVNADFDVGNLLVISDEIIIERRRRQLKLTVLGEGVNVETGKLAVQGEIREYPEDFPLFRRSPRIYLREPVEEVRLENPPVRIEEQRNAIMQMIVPPLGMVVASGLTSALVGSNPVFMLGMGGASLLTAGFSVSSFIANRRDIRRKNADAERVYNEYLLKTASCLERLNMEQRHAMTYNYPSVPELEQMLEEYSPRIYERMDGNADFLNVSLGHGTVPVSYRFTYSREDSREKSELQKFVDENVIDRYGRLENMPVVIPLRGETVGLAGNHAALRIALQTILFQVAVFQSYRDVQLVALVSEDEYEGYWKEWRWLPHFQLQSLNLRGIVHSAQTRDMVLSSLYQLLSARRQAVRDDRSVAGVEFKPHIVLVIQDEKWLSGDNLNEFLMGDVTRYGVTVIWAKDSVNMLPETVTTLVDYPSSRTASLISVGREYRNQKFIPDSYSSRENMDDALLHLANLEHVEVEGNSIPDSVTFLEMYNVKRVDELDVIGRWKKADTSRTLAVPLGLRGRDDVVRLNLHERAHGPHGLIAGTTGSGKSEVIQSYILSLAVNFAPEDVGFLPIDFKGGGMANLFRNLPHLMGAITNLDGAGARRALTSIHAELEKRQRLFSEYGVNHINDYTGLYKKGKTASSGEKGRYPDEPLPHLFLISDEFAELKANEPDFMDELVSIARIGRSLGVHLILATQKPDGVVSNQIWSNSRFKIALKVSDVSDSNEILHTPDAAAISQVGRAYLQVGNNEIYELFQTAYSGAPYRPDFREDESADTRIWWINHLGQAELITEDLSGNCDDALHSDGRRVTELDAVVDEIGRAARKVNAVIPARPWLPPLPEKLVTPVLDYREEWRRPLDLSVPLGMMDIPEKQKQEEFVLDLKEAGHMAVYGSQGYGKSSVLQTIAMNLARRNSPEQVQFNLFDFGTNGLLNLRGLPHTIDIVNKNEDVKLRKYIRIIIAEMNRRRKLFTQNEVSTLGQYEERTGSSLPVIVTMIDGFDSILETRIQEKFHDFYSLLLRDGIPLGMYTISTALRVSTFRNSVSDNIATKMALYLIEDDSLSQLFGRDALIEQDVVGRMQIRDESVHEVQIYLCCPGNNDMQRSAALKEEISRMDVDWNGSRPAGVPMLPEHLEISSFRRSPRVRECLGKMELPLGCNVETADVVSCNPAAAGYVMLLNDSVQQAEYLERTLMFDFSQLSGMGIRTAIVDLDGSYGSQRDEFGCYVDSVSADGFIQGLDVEIEKRRMMNSFSRILVYVPNAHLFGKTTVVPLKNIENILKNGHRYGIHLIFSGNIKAVNGMYGEIPDALKNGIRTGTIGTKMAEQNYVKGNFNYGEEVVGLDETNFFVGRRVERIKLVSRWGDEDEQ